MPLKLKTRGKNKTLWLTGTLLGERIRESTRTSDRRIAEAILVKRMKEIEEQAVHGPVAAFTFAEAMEFYVRRANPKPKQAWYLNKLLDYWGKWRCQDITPHALLEYEKVRHKGKVCNNTLKRAIYGPMCAVLKMAAENRLCPPVLLPKPKGEKKIVQPAPEAHISTLLACRMHQWLRACILIMTYHGVRPSDLKRLRWEHVSFSNGTMLLIHTKNGRSQMVRMHPEVQDAMQIHLAQVVPFGGKPSPVFPKLQVPEPAMNLNQYIRTVCKQNALPYYSTHKLGRHAFASRLLMSGHTLKDVQEGGNWASISVVADLYGHLERSHVDQIVTQMKIVGSNLDQVGKTPEIDERKQATRN
jgi:integrase